jgi:hypothetical protein
MTNEKLVIKLKGIGRYGQSSLFSSIFGVVIVLIISVVVSIIVWGNFIDNTLSSVIGTSQNDISENRGQMFNDTIQSISDRLYDKTISRIDFAITLFSCGLVLFTIVFGFFYFSKIKEAESLIKSVQNTPDLFFKQFYQEQFNKAIRDVFSTNNIARHEAINSLAYNPEISASDYGVLETAVNLEFKYDRNAFYYSNINTLFNLLMKIDDKKAIRTLLGILSDKYIETSRTMGLLQYIIVDNSLEAKNFIEGKLLNDNIIGPQIISQLVTNNLLDEYSEYILTTCPSNIVQTVFSMSTSNYWKIKTDRFFEYLMCRKEADNQIINMISQSSIMNTREKSEIILKFYSKDKVSLEQALDSFIHTINSNTQAKREFIDLANKAGLIADIDAYLEKNKYIQNYFKDIYTPSDTNKHIGENDSINNSSIIKEHGLKFNAGKITDKDGNEYVAEDYSYSPMFGRLIKVVSCVEIDKKIIPVSEISNQEVYHG